MHPDAASRERERDAARADAELERGSVAGQLGQEVDDRIDDARLEHVGGLFVVALGHALSEVVLGHTRTLAKALRHLTYSNMGI